MKRKTILISSILASVLLLGTIVLFAMGDKNKPQNPNSGTVFQPIQPVGNGMAWPQQPHEEKPLPLLPPRQGNSPISLVSNTEPMESTTVVTPQTTIMMTPKTNPISKRTVLPEAPVNQTANATQNPLAQGPPSQSLPPQGLNGIEDLLSGLEPPVTDRGHPSASAMSQLGSLPLPPASPQPQGTSRTGMPPSSGNIQFTPSPQSLQEMQIPNFPQGVSPPELAQPPQFPKTVDVYYDETSVKMPSVIAKAQQESFQNPQPLQSPQSEEPFPPSPPVAVQPFTDMMTPVSDRNLGGMNGKENYGNGNQGITGIALPGPRQTEGARTPQILIEKSMPPEVPINEPVTIKIIVRNSGLVTAKNVTLIDRVPRGTRLEETSPKATITEQGTLSWDLGDLEAKAEKTVEVRVLPFEEGEFGSVAMVTFSVEAGAKGLITKPGLTMEVRTVQDSYLMGENVVFEVVLSNPGTGLAENISLEESVPDGLYHPKGKKMSSPVGSLRPGETKHLKLTMQGIAPGEAVNYLVATAAGGLIVESQTPVMILAPTLDLEIDGPKMRYLERKAVYQFSVGNSGNASAKDIRLSAQLPEGVDFVSTDSNGIYDPSKHIVHWALEELPAQQSGEIELVLLPKQAGDYQIRFTGQGSGDLNAQTFHEMTVQGIAALCFEVTDLADPVEIGRDVTYEVRVANQGTKSSENVKVNVLLSKGMQLVDASAPVQHQTIEGNLIFGNLPELAPKEEQIYKIKAKCLEVGDHRIRVQVQSDDLQHPVTKEESTKVYGDEE
jgi:uncharacterized repeat protein (TIGR01451 family)